MLNKYLLNEWMHELSILKKWYMIEDIRNVSGDRYLVSNGIFLSQCRLQMYYQDFTESQTKAKF
jgi:hypothetical protein